MQGQAQSDPHVPLLRIFVNSLQQPLRIFVEPGEVTNRPKLNGGGVLCEAVSDANIVLVSPDTTSADQLIESWAGEKVFLDTVWVYESSRRGAAYLDNEGWGGYTVGNGDGTAIQNHLPTPRQTPSESKASSDDSAMQSQVPQPPTQPMHAGPSALPLFPSTVQQGTIPNGQFSMMPLSYMIHNPGLSSVDPVQYLQMATMQQQQGTNPLQMPVAQYLAMLGLYSQQGPPSYPRLGRHNRAHFLFHNRSPSR
ncbi:hypothetical protein C8Q80DRAFT_65043 [Daedaleopsis nitida]|nr:hypothetical protein C8Q80DRAFT_65043 [Daedaleopsis nitida]